MTTEQRLQVTKADGVATLTLASPAPGNPIDLALASQLLSEATRCDEDESVRCVILAGAGAHFCVGGDLQGMADAGDEIDTFLEELVRTFHHAIKKLAHLRKPLVTAVQGAAAGAGVSLAILGDIALAAQSANFTWAYNKIGFTPDGGISWFLPRLIGLRRTQEFALLGKRLTASEAANWGLITRVVPDADLMAEALVIAKTLANSSIHAVGRTRDLLLSSYSNGFKEQLDAEAHAIVASGQGADGREGVAAFFAKRKPAFK